MPASQRNRHPRALAQPALVDGTLVQVMNRYHGKSPGVFAVYPSRSQPSAALKDLVAFFVEEASKLKP